MTVRSAWLLTGGEDPGQTRQDTRLAPVGTFTPAGELATAQGVIPGGDPFAASGSGAMSLQVGPGRAVVQGTGTQGSYPVAVDAPESVTFTDGDAAFARIDTVCLHVADLLFDTSGQTLARIEVVPGTPADVPQAPTLDPGYLPLWDVTVPAGASAAVGGVDWGSALDDRRRYTVAVGGITPRGVAGDAGAYDGQYGDFDGVLYRWSATDGAWTLYRPPSPAPVTATGSAVTSASAGWSLMNAQAVKVGGMITWRVQVERTGAAISASSSGNVVDTAMFTLDSAWRPNTIFGSERMPTIVTNSYGDGAAYITADTGLVELVTWGPGATVTNGDWYRVMMTYPA